MLSFAAFASHSHVRFTIRFSLTIVSSFNKYLLVISQFIYECGIINIFGILYVTTRVVYNINV